MSQGRTWDRLGWAIGALAIVGLLMTPTIATAQTVATAQTAAPAAGPNTGAVSVQWTNTIVTQYIFRGVQLENNGLIYQPDLLLNFALYEGDGLLQSLDAYIEIWNSLHSENTGWANSNQPWFETRYIVGVSGGLPEGFTLDTFMVFYTSPNGAFNAITELDIKLAYDDTDLMAGAGLPALAPYFLVAIELEEPADGENTYFELGIAPSATIIESETAPVTLTIPVTLGLAGDRYYYDGCETFGFVRVGLDFSMPVTCIPAEYGAWDASAGVALVFANDDIEVAGQDDIEVLGQFALTMSY